MSDDNDILNQYEKYVEEIKESKKRKSKKRKSKKDYIDVVAAKVTDIKFKDILKDFEDFICKNIIKLRTYDMLFDEDCTCKHYKINIFKIWYTYFKKNIKLFHMLFDDKTHKIKKTKTKNKLINFVKENEDNVLNTKTEDLSIEDNIKFIDKLIHLIKSRCICLNINTKIKNNSIVLKPIYHYGKMLNEIMYKQCENIGKNNIELDKKIYELIDEALELKNNLFIRFYKQVIPFDESHKRYSQDYLFDKKMNVIIHDYSNSPVKIPFENMLVCIRETLVHNFKNPEQKRDVEKMYEYAKIIYEKTLRIHKVFEYKKDPVKYILSLINVDQDNIRFSLFNTKQTKTKNVLISMRDEFYKIHKQEDQSETNYLLNKYGFLENSTKKVWYSDMVYSKKTSIENLYMIAKYLLLTKKELYEFYEYFVLGTYREDEKIKKIIKYKHLHKFFNNDQDNKKKWIEKINDKDKYYEIISYFINKEFIDITNIGVNLKKKYGNQKKIDTKDLNKKEKLKLFVTRYFYSVFGDQEENDKISFYTMFIQGIDKWKNAKQRIFYKNYIYSNIKNKKIDTGQQHLQLSKIQNRLASTKLNELRDKYFEKWLIKKSNEYYRSFTNKKNSELKKKQIKEEIEKFIKISGIEIEKKKYKLLNTFGITTNKSLSIYKHLVF